MIVHKKQQVSLAHSLLACLLLSLLVGGCSSNAPNDQSAAINQNAEISDSEVSPPDSSETTTTETNAKTDWVTILPNQEAYALKFTDSGTLTHQDKVLLSEIPVSFSSDGSVTYAQSLIVSNPSPSARFHFLKACEDTTPQNGLCWSVFLADKTEEAAQKVDVGKYGGANWVQWSEDERYAVLIEQHDGASWFVAVNLDTGDSQLSEQLPPNVDVTSFEWTGDRTFRVEFRDCNTADCDFEGNVEEISNS